LEDEKNNLINLQASVELQTRCDMSV